MKIENDQYREKNMGPLFDICANRHGGNEHSKKANEIAHKYKIGARQRILEALERFPMACWELEEFTGLSHQTCSARLSELKNPKQPGGPKIKIVGERKTRSGAMAAVYQAL